MRSVVVVLPASMCALMPMLRYRSMGVVRGIVYFKGETRDPSVSLNGEADLDVPFGRDFALIDRTNVDGLAGVHQTGQGTLFDLDDLLADALVQAGLANLGAIGFVLAAAFETNLLLTLRLQELGRINMLERPVVLGLALLILTTLLLPAWRRGQAR